MKPQFLHILAWQKYWLMAVSSTVRARFKRSMTSGIPFMPALLGASCWFDVGFFTDSPPRKQHRGRGGRIPAPASIRPCSDRNKPSLAAWRHASFERLEPLVERLLVLLDGLGGPRQAHVIHVVL